jgi:hypothetical protein
MVRVDTPDENILRRIFHACYWRVFKKARVRQNDAQNLLVEKLHIRAGSIDLLRLSNCSERVLGLCYHGHAQSSNNGLSLAPWKELP